MTVEEFLKQYETDEALQAEVKELLKEGKATPPEFIAFAKKHGIVFSLMDVPKYAKKLKEAGLLK